MKGLCNALAVTLLCLGASVNAETSTHVVIHAGHLLDVKSGKMLVDPAVVVKDGNIVSVDAMADVTVPAGATRIELPNATLLPGMIDAHSHLTAVRKYAWKKLSGPRLAILGVQNARDTLLAGFTTVRDVGASGYSDVALRDAINAGDVPGPRMLVSGEGIGSFVTGRGCDKTEQEQPVATNDRIAQLQRMIRENARCGADLLKIKASGDIANPAPAYTLEELQAIVTTAHQLGQKVAAHTQGAEAIRWAAQAGVDSIEHGFFVDDAAIAEMKKRGTYLVPTVGIGYVIEESPPGTLPIPEGMVKKQARAIKAHRVNFANAAASGVKIVLGTDIEAVSDGKNALELTAMMRAGGLTPLQAIQAATVNAASLLGWEGKVGTLEPGAWADVIAVDGNPLDDITTLERVKFVMKGGHVFKNDYAN